jgi:hypothetical protein
MQDEMFLAHVAQPLGDLRAPDQLSNSRQKAGNLAA